MGRGEGGCWGGGAAVAGVEERVQEEGDGEGACAARGDGERAVPLLLLGTTEFVAEGRGGDGGGVHWQYSCYACNTRVMQFLGDLFVLLMTSPTEDHIYL